MTTTGIEKKLPAVTDEELKEWHKRFKEHHGGVTEYATVVEFVEKYMPTVANPELFADYLHKIFEVGDSTAVPAFKGLLYLVLERNFAIDNLYQMAYGMLKPSVLCSEHAVDYFRLIDRALSSPYVPKYMLAAYAKRLARMALTAPVNPQLMMLNLMKNIFFIDRSIFEQLLNRKEPATLDADPYDMEAPMEKCGAVESSLWELKAITQHWYIRMADRSKFAFQNCPEQPSPFHDEDVIQTIFKKLKTVEGHLNSTYNSQPLKATEDLICD